MEPCTEEDDDQEKSSFLKETILDAINFIKNKFCLCHLNFKKERKQSGNLFA